MFTAKELNTIDTGYFSIIASGGCTVTLQSKNTGHCWHILLQEYPHFRSYMIYHTITGEHSTTSMATEPRFPAASARSETTISTGFPGKAVANTIRRYAHEAEKHQGRIHQPQLR